MNIKEKIKKAPQEAGIYLFRNKRGRILYVGKASNLRSRLHSYLHQGWKDKMVKEASTLSWRVLDSDIEALIEETNLIKRHKPRYNVLMRDDKNYLYVGFTKEKYPRIITTHQPIDRLTAGKFRVNFKHSYIGPFTEANIVKSMLRHLRNTFPYCVCKTFHKQKCVNAQIGKCPGYCCMKNNNKPETVKAYAHNISAIKMILRGKKTRILKELEKRMLESAKKRRYEDAGILRNQILGIERIFAHSPYLKKEISVERLKGLAILMSMAKLPEIPRRVEGYDISHIQGKETVGSMVVFTDGLPDKKEYKHFIIRSLDGIDDTKAIREIIQRRMKHEDWKKPDYILVDGGRGQLNATLQALKQHKFPEKRVAALAKKDETLFKSGRPGVIKLKNLPYPLLHLLVSIRDEAHRFAIAFHRRRRRSRGLE